MINSIRFEEIQEKHLPQIREIYNFYVINTTISFHSEPLTLAEIRSNVIHSNYKYKSYVIVEDEEEVKGYILITQYKNKQAYDVTAEVTIYLDPSYLGHGVGSKAIGFLEEIGRANGFHVWIATICTENERSIRLFERHGYSKCAHFKEIGFKFGRRLDIASYQKIIH